MEAATGSCGNSGAWAGHVAAAQRRPPAAVEATRKLWDAAYPLEPFDVDLEAVANAAGRAQRYITFPQTLQHVPFIGTWHVTSSIRTQSSFQAEAREFTGS